MAAADDRIFGRANLTRAENKLRITHSKTWRSVIYAFSNDLKTPERDWNRIVYGISQRYKTCNNVDISTSQSRIALENGKIIPGFAELLIAYMGIQPASDFAQAIRLAEHTSFLSMASEKNVAKPEPIIDVTNTPKAVAFNRSTPDETPEPRVDAATIPKAVAFNGPTLGKTPESWSSSVPSNGKRKAIKLTIDLHKAAENLLSMDEEEVSFTKFKYAFTNAIQTIQVKPNSGLNHDSKWRCLAQLIVRTASEEQLKGFYTTSGLGEDTAVKGFANLMIDVMKIDPNSLFAERIKCAERRFLDRRLKQQGEDQNGQSPA